MIAHAMNGREDACSSIKVYMNTLLDSYCSHMTEAGRSSFEMETILRDVAGLCGHFLYHIYYVIHCHDFFPVESGVDKEYLWDAFGILGWKLLRLAYDTDYASASLSADEIRSIMFNLLEEEVSLAQSMFESRKARRQPRKSSMLRASNRRISDTEMVHLMAQHVRRSTIRGSIVREDALLE